MTEALRPSRQETLQRSLSAHAGADRHGNYTIRHEGRVVKRVTALKRYLDRPLWGSRKLERAALDEAKSVIEWHHAARG